MLIEDSDAKYEDLLYDKKKDKPTFFETTDPANMYGKDYEKYNTYRFKHPFDFGNDESYSVVDYDKKEEKKR